MNYLADRRKEVGLTQKEVADKVGVSEATVSRWESGAIANMRRDKIALYAKALHTTPTFIMTGEEADAPESKPSVPPGFEPPPETYQVPLVGNIACGTPILAEQNVEQMIDVPVEVRGCDFALHCKGDSMIDAGIRDGDLVCIHKQPMVENGEIAAVRIGEEATLKRVYYDGDSITLMAANPAVPPKTYYGEALNDITIEGRAISYTHWL